MFPSFSKVVDAAATADVQTDAVNLKGFCAFQLQTEACI